MRTHGFKQQSMPKKWGEAKGVCIDGKVAVAGFDFGDVAIIAADGYALGQAFKKLTGNRMDWSLVQEVSIFKRSDVKAVS